MLRDGSSRWWWARSARPSAAPWRECARRGLRARAARLSAPRATERWHPRAVDRCRRPWAPSSAQPRRRARRRRDAAGRRSTPGPCAPRSPAVRCPGGSSSSPGAPLVLDGAHNPAAPTPWRGPCREVAGGRPVVAVRLGAGRQGRGRDGRRPRAGRHATWSLRHAPELQPRGAVRPVDGLAARGLAGAGGGGRGRGGRGPRAAALRRGASRRAGSGGRRPRDRSPLSAGLRPRIAAAPEVLLLRLRAPMGANGPTEANCVDDGAGCGGRRGRDPRLLRPRIPVRQPLPLARRGFASPAAK